MRSDATRMQQMAQHDISVMGVDTDGATGRITRWKAFPNNLAWQVEANTMATAVDELLNYLGASNESVETSHD